MFINTLVKTSYIFKKFVGDDPTSNLVQRVQGGDGGQSDPGDPEPGLYPTRRDAQPGRTGHGERVGRRHHPVRHLHLSGRHLVHPLHEQEVLRPGGLQHLQGVRQQHGEL